MLPQKKKSKSSAVHQFSWTLLPSAYRPTEAASLFRARRRWSRDPLHNRDPYRGTRACGASGSMNETCEIVRGRRGKIGVPCLGIVHIRVGVCAGYQCRPPNALRVSTFNLPQHPPPTLRHRALGTLGRACLTAEGRRTMAVYKYAPVAQVSLGFEV